MTDDPTDAEIEALAKKIRARNPERFDRTRDELSRLTDKSIDELDPLTAAAIIIESEAERDALADYLRTTDGGDA